MARRTGHLFIVNFIRIILPKLESQCDFNYFINIQKVVVVVVVTENLKI